MQTILGFLKNIGLLKNIQRRGILFYGVKSADSATDHSFRLALMVWVLGYKRKLNIEKALKMALIHDLAKIHTGDITPYDGLFSKKEEREKRYTLAWRWRRLSLKEKEKRHEAQLKKEEAGVKKIVKNLPEKLKEDIGSVWKEFKANESKEAKFVYQLDRIENLLEAVETKEEYEEFPTLPWWEHADEVIHDGKLLDFLEVLSEEEVRVIHKKEAKKRKG